MGCTLKRNLFSISYTKDNNAITDVQPTSDSVSNKTILTPRNLVNQHTLAAVLSVPIDATKWWNMQFNITGISEQINAVYKKDAINREQMNVNINGTQSFRLPKEWSAELSGFYQSPSLD